MEEEIMVFYYVTIMNEDGRFRATYDCSENGQARTVEMARKFENEVLFQVGIENWEQGKEINDLVARANDTGKFDKEAMRKLLE
jgi:hypothetical protein